MARRHANILTRIWNDEDFVALTGDAQRFYLFLISQGDLNFAGVIPLRPARWATKASDATPAKVRKGLAALKLARYIVTDETTEELLVRTYVRNSEIWKQPNVMRRMAEDTAHIESPALMNVLRDELCRLPLDELSNESKDGKPSLRKVIQEIVDGLIHTDTHRGTLPETLPESLTARGK